MSLTSYRTAPPRDFLGTKSDDRGRAGFDVHVQFGRANGGRSEKNCLV